MQLPPQANDGIEEEVATHIRAKSFRYYFINKECSYMKNGVKRYGTILKQEKHTATDIPNFTVVVLDKWDSQQVRLDMLSDNVQIQHSRSGMPYDSLKKHTPTSLPKYLQDAEVVN